MSANPSSTPTNSPPPKPSGAGVKKKQKRPFWVKSRRTGSKLWHAFVKENRHRYPDLSYFEVMKALGPEWKASPNNPKNA